MVARLVALVAADDDDRADASSSHDDRAVLASMKADPGRVSLATMLGEIDKLQAARAIGLPADLFVDVVPKVVAAWRSRADAESPSHLRGHPAPTRLTLLAALVWRREREITDMLVELLISVVHLINARAEKRVTEELVNELRRVRGKENLLFRVAEAAVEHPDDTVREAVYPVVGEQTLHDLVREYKASGTTYRRTVQTTLKASYTNHYRRGLIKLLEVLSFASSNTAHRPVLDAIALLRRYAGRPERYYALGEHVPVDHVVPDAWREPLYRSDGRGRERIVRTVYEVCVFAALRDRLRCKEVWVAGADRWRNPDEDLPADFDQHRVEHYASLGKPLDPAAFIAELQGEMRRELTALNGQLPKLAWVDIAERSTGAIRLTPLDAVPEPRNLRRLKAEVTRRWGVVHLLDMLKEADLRIGFTGEFTPVGTREVLARDVLQRRLLLAIYGYGTNTGLRRIAQGEHGHSEDDLRYARSRYMNLYAARRAAARIANATFAARRQSIWGAGTTAVASDSTHFGAYDQNIFTEWHVRYGGRGVLVYWHVERNSMAVYSQLISCSASEVAAMVEGAIRHGTDMDVEANYTDSHGASEIGFGITRLLGFDLLPRLKRINKVKLCRPAADEPDAYPRLGPALTRPIRWDLIAQQYDQMIKYATAIRVGTASTEAILRRFTRANNTHPTYQAMLEVGRAQKTIFVARYLRVRELQREINDGLNVMESWNGANSVIHYGRSGEFATNRRDEQEMGAIALHILQAALVYVNTLMIQDVLAEPTWVDVLTDEDLRGLTPLFWTHMSPYGVFRLQMDQRLALANPAPTEDQEDGSTALG